MRIDTGNSTGEFLSTLSLRRATSSKIISSSIIAYFYPRSPCGERQSVGYSAVRLFIFLSTLSLRRATAQDILTALNNIFLSTLSLRRATDSNMNPQLEEGISIHALLAESDAPANVQHRKNQIFLSTLSLRRATMGRYEEPFRGRISIHALLAESDTPEPPRVLRKPYFYPRSPCGERPAVLCRILRM